MGAGNGSAPLRLRLQFFRAQDAGNAHAFATRARFGPQDYILPTADGASPTARFEWTPEFLEDLRAVRRPGRDPEVAQRVGEALHRFVRDAGWAQMGQAICEALDRERAVHLTLCSSAAELYALPWELLTLRSGQCLGELSRMLLRYEWPESPGAELAPVPRPEGGRVLFAWSAAGGAVPAAQHLIAIESACRAGSLCFTRSRDEIPNASVHSIAAALEAAQGSGAPVAVLHLLCHGSAAGSGYGLVLNGDDGGDGGDGTVDAAELRRQLAPFRKMVPLVILSACDSGNAGALGSHLGSIAQALHRCGFGAVIASRFPLSVSGSVALAQTLYHRLLVETDSLEAAFLAARTRLAQDALKQPRAERELDWISLQLYARHEDGDDTRPVVFRPFRGLLAFQPEHHRFYFGRDREIAEVLQDLRGRTEAREGQRARLLIVAGASGTGKSSLVLAGVVPRLREADPQLVLLRMRPGADPQGALDRAMAELPAGRRGLLVVDQLEEVFTHTADPAVRSAFVRRIWQLAAADSPQLLVLLTLRVDFIGRCGEIVLDDRGLRLDRVAYDEAHRVFIAQLHPEQLRAIITLPAARAGLRLEAGLVERILQDVGYEPGALPLVEDTLDVLWQRREDNVLTQAAYDELGGVTGALQRRADAVVEALGAAALPIVRRLFLSLVTLAEDTAPYTRRRIPLCELRAAFAAPELDALERVLGELVAARLLVQDHDAQQPQIEVAHEALLRQWPRLRAWLEEGRASLLVQRRLLQAAREWQQQQKDESLLYRGAQLAQACAWRALWEGALPDSVQQFLDAGLALRDKEAKKAAAQQHREHAAAEQLRQLGLDDLVRRGYELLAEKHEPALALPLLQQAYREGSRHPALRYLLRTALQDFDAQELVLEHPRQVFAACYSPDGRRIVTACVDGRVRLFAADGGQLLWERDVAGGSLEYVQISPEGWRLAVIASGGSVKIWATASGDLLTELADPELQLTGALWSPDGLRVAAVSREGAVTLFDAATGRRLLRIPGAVGSAAQLSFRPDGRALALGGADASVYVRCTDIGRIVASLPVYADGVLSVAWSPDGHSVAVRSQDRVLRIFSTAGWSGPAGTASDEAACGPPLAELGARDGLVQDAIWSPDGRHLLVRRFGEAPPEIFAADTWQPVAALVGPAGLQSQEAEHAAWSADGRHIVVGYGRALAVFWATSGTCVACLYSPDRPLLDARFSPDGRHLLTTGTDCSARVLLAAGARLLSALHVHPHEISTACFSPDGQRILIACADGAVRILATLDGTCLLRLPDHGGAVHGAAFSPDGQRIVTACADGAVRIFTAEEGQLLLRLPEQEGAALSAAFSPDGQQLLTTCEGGTARLYSADSGRLLHGLRAEDSDDPTALIPVRRATWSSDGRRILAACIRGTVVLFAAESGLQQARAFLGSAMHLRCEHVVLSPDGKALCAVGMQLAELRAAQDFRPMAPLAQHESVHALDACFSADGTCVATACEDGTARLFAADSGLLLSVFIGHRGPVRSVAFNPDGTRLLTAGQDGVVRIFDVAAESRSPEELDARIGSRVPPSIEREV